MIEEGIVKYNLTSPIAALLDNRCFWEQVLEYFGSLISFMHQLTVTNDPERNINSSTCLIADPEGREICLYLRTVKHILRSASQAQLSHRICPATIPLVIEIAPQMRRIQL